MSKNKQWQKFKKHHLCHPRSDFAIDISRMAFSDVWLENFHEHFDQAAREMSDLENGSIANPDEIRMVGHYWLRDPERTPSRNVYKSIVDTKAAVLSFAKDVREARIKGKAGPFSGFLLIGIGGSALGPQFMDHALRPGPGLKAYFLDNTDPDGMDRTLSGLKGRLGETLVIVVSKSGGTKETRNGMLEAKAAYEAEGLSFAAHAACITEKDSALDHLACDEGWLRRFEMWEWVGGRTSITSAVGILPAALSGYDVEAFLDGAKEMDEWTRQKRMSHNPAALLSAMWYFAGNGKGSKAMVVLPYKDRLELFGKYLQQLVMESLGKERDLLGNSVHQGLTVFGNKGSTDQHAYIQQLRDGLPDFFATFIEVKKARTGVSIEVEPGVTSGDFLEGFLLGTRAALHENGRQSITITIGEVCERSLGQLVALFERAVGFYASYVEINAYNQPGVEAGKKAAQEILLTKKKVQEYVSKLKRARSVEQVAKAIDQTDNAETVFKLLDYMSANPESGIVRKSKNNGPKSTFMRLPKE